MKAHGPSLGYVSLIRVRLLVADLRLRVATIVAIEQRSAATTRSIAH